MYQIIAPTLFQNKICRLPGIGTLQMIAHSAETDFVTAQIKSPAETIAFLQEDKGENSFNEFSAMSEILQKSLDRSGSYTLPGIGTFTKDTAGNISFAAISIDPVFIFPVSAERVIRPDEPHAMLVGDQHTTNLQMTEFFTVQPIVNNRWRFWAIFLAIAGIIILLFYFLLHGFNGLGNVFY